LQGTASAELDNWQGMAQQGGFDSVAQYLFTVISGIRNEFHMPEIRFSGVLNFARPSRGFRSAIFTKSSNACGTAVDVEIQTSKKSVP